MALPRPYGLCTHVSIYDFLGDIAKEVEHCIRAFSEQQGGVITELNIQIDHVTCL